LASKVNTWQVPFTRENFLFSYYIVTDLIRELPGNGSVNSPTYMGGQQYSRSVFYVACVATVDFYF
jgi:hypothetical protein